LNTSPEADLIAQLATHSRQLITSLQAPSGAYPASPSFSQYGYSWFRDGAFIADAVSRVGERNSATAFHRFCATVITDRAELAESLISRAQRREPIAIAEHLPTRVRMDGQDSADDGWWNFQLDGYGTWLWALQNHLARTGLDGPGYRAAVELCVRYLAAFWDTPCYDWWEEHVDRQHLATLTSLHGGLAAVTRLADVDHEIRSLAAATVAAISEYVARKGISDGHLVKWVGSTEVDASLLAAVAPFAVVSDEVAASTVAAIEAQLVRDRGVYRYLQDTFYGGGRWPLLAGFLGLAFLRLGRREDAKQQLQWIASTATPELELPEQVSDLLLAPQYQDEWVQRWGTVASPLLWSHAMFLILADELGAIERNPR
jgi:GH15 family glucan-1,4-alpha-glucosidase